MHDASSPGPSSPAERNTQLKRLGQMLIVVAVSVLASILSTGYYFTKIVDNRQSNLLAQANADKPDFDVNPATQRDKDPKAGVMDRGTERDRFLDALGNLVGVHLYQCYLNIGLLADCTEGDIYSEEEAQKWLDRILAHMEQVDKRLENLGRFDLAAEEKKSLDRCRQVSSLLHSQALELKEYWKTSDKERAARYHKAREEAWAGISDVLDIPKEQEAPIEGKGKEPEVGTGTVKARDK